MKKHILINLFGSAGKRTVEITPRDGFSTRHIQAPRDTGVPSIFAPVQPTAPQGNRTASQEVETAETETAQSTVLSQEDNSPVRDDGTPQQPSPAEVSPPSLLEVLQWMAASENHTGWLIVDEILFVATTQYQMKFNQRSLLDALRLLYQKGCLAYKLNRFDQHTFRLIENQETTLKSLLSEVDAIMDEGGAA